MLRLRKFVLGLLWFVPFIYGLAAISLPFVIYRIISGLIYGNGHTVNTNPEQRILFVATQGLLIFLGISPVALCITSAGTILQYHRRKENTRSWAIACGIAFVASAVPLIVAGAVSVFYAGFSASRALGLLLLPMIHLAAGASIIVAFLPRCSVSDLLSAEARPARVKGDGTTSLSYLFTIAVVVCGLWAIDSQIHRWGQQHGLPQKSGLLLEQLSFFGALFISTALHEFGHIAAGLSVGMKLLSIRIGPFHTEIKEGRWQLISPSSWKCLFQGGVKIIPPSPQEYRKSHAIWTAAGGPLANLAACGVALLALFAAKGSFYEPAWELLGTIAAICLVFFLANLIPLREAAAYSDGARIYQILTGNVLEDFRRIVAMTEASKIGPVRPQGFDISLIEETASNNALEAYNTAFLYLAASDYYFDHERLQEARAALSKAEAAQEEMKSVWKESCDALVLRAVCIAQNREMAEKWWERSLQAKPFDMKNNSEFALLAYCICKDRFAEAEQVWRRQLERTGRLPENGERAFDLHYLSHLRRLLDEALAGGREYFIPSTVQNSGFAET